MSTIPVAARKRTSYENFVVECPFCRRENIFNRASDLRTFEPIAGLNVSCLHDDCGRAYRIAGDSINSAHEMLIFDCYELIDRKHYMNCILSLAQAYEVFFSLYFRVELLFRPFAADGGRDIDKLNGLADKLFEGMRPHTFAAMRALFFHYLLKVTPARTLVDAETVIISLPPKLGLPKDSAIDNLGDAKLVPLLRALKSTDINSIRNNVVHKQAYRPTLQQAQDALEEARKILFPLASHFQLHDDINWYTMNP